MQKNKIKLKLIVNLCRAKAFAYMRVCLYHRCSVHLCSVHIGREFVCADRWRLQTVTNYELHRLKWISFNWMHFFSFFFFSFSPHTACCVVCVCVCADYVHICDKWEELIVAIYSRWTCNSAYSQITIHKSVGLPETSSQHHKAHTQNENGNCVEILHSYYFRKAKWCMSVRVYVCVSSQSQSTPKKPYSHGIQATVSS